MNLVIKDAIKENEVETVYSWISNSYWGRYLEDISTFKKAIANSECFTLYDNHELIGFLRVVSDMATFAYLMDFIIIESYRNKGIGSEVLRYVVSLNKFKNVKWLLTSSMAKGFYLKNNFTEVVNEHMLQFKL